MFIFPFFFSHICKLILFCDIGKTKNVFDNKETVTVYALRWYGM